MTDQIVVAAVTLCVVVGLAAMYVRLRREFSRGVTLIAILLVAGATPLLLAIVRGALSEAGPFALLAIAVLVAERARTRTLQAVLLIALVVIMPLVTPDAAARPTLFAPQNGLLALTPVVYVALIGTLVRTRAHVAEAAAAVVALVLWPMTDTVPTPVVALLAPGLATALEWARRRPLVAALPVIVLPIVWNYWLMVQYTAGTIPKDAPVSFATMVRQQADIHTRQPYIYPFAFPGNVVAAWREGVPVARYDLLAAEPRRGDFELILDGTSDRFLLDGWGPLGRNAGGSYRTIASGRAEAVIPLAARGSALDIMVRAALRGGAPGADEGGQLQIAINGHVVGQAAVGPGAPSEIRLRLTPTATEGAIRAGYNRVTLVSSSQAPVLVYRLRLSSAA